METKALVMKDDIMFKAFFSKKGNEKFLEIKSKVYKYMGSHSSINRVFEGVMYILIVVAGAFALVGGKISPADYIAYLLYISTLLTSIRKIIDFAEQFQRGMTGIERFAEIMDTEPTIKDKENAEEFKNTIYTCSILIANISNIIEPIMPDAANKIRTYINMSKPTWEYVELEEDIELNNIKPIFNRI